MNDRMNSFDASHGAHQPAPDGLQPERTALAWRRTGLALTVASLAAVRILPRLVGNWAIVPSGFGIALAVYIVAAAHLRYRRIRRTLESDDPEAIPAYGGGLPAVVAGLVVGGGIFTLVGLLAAAVHGH